MGGRRRGAGEDMLGGNNLDRFGELGSGLDGKGSKGPLCAVAYCSMPPSTVWELQPERSSRPEREEAGSAEDLIRTV